MAMFTSEILAKFHALPIAEAVANTRTLAGFHGQDADKAEAEYKALRTKAEAAVVVKGLNEANVQVAAAGSDQAKALQGGAVGRVVLAEDGSVRITWTLPTMTTSSGGGRKRGRGGRKFKYFHNGEPLPRNTSVKGFLMDNYPDSEAVRTIREYEANEEAGVSAAKIGAWEAIAKDEAIRAHFTREQVER